MKSMIFLTLPVFLVCMVNTWAAQRYQTEVPDTLDLAERAELSIAPALRLAEGVPGEPKTSEGGGPTTVHDACCGPKLLESLAYLLVMTGSTHDLEREKRIIASYEAALGPHNLFYVPPSGPIDESWANVFGQGRLMLAWLALYQRDGDERYVRLMRNLTQGLREIAQYKDDYAYYPTELIENAYYVFAIRRSGWKRLDEPKAFHPVKEGQVPNLADRDGHQFDARVGITAYIGSALRPLPRYCALTSDTQVLDLTGRLARFLRKPEMWQAYGEPPEINGPAHAHYGGHLHSHLIALRALLDYARLTGDTALMQFVRDGYDYTRNFGLSAIGWYPEWTNNNVGEGCEIADMVALGIRLSDMSVGDYWDDVDRTVRNQLVENQHLVGGHIGEFNAGAMPTQMQSNGVAICCTGNCTQALYYAWEAIVRCKDGVAQVNLLLNRASPWLDVDSYLPYEGKVVLHNKTARTISVRIPLWVDKSAVKCRVGDSEIPPVWVGQRLLFQNVKKNADLTIEFPMSQYTITTRPVEPSGDAVSVLGISIPYTITFKGNTVVDIGPRMEGWGRRGNGTRDVIQIYERERYKQDKAPMKKVTRTIADTIPEW